MVLMWLSRFAISTRLRPNKIELEMLQLYEIPGSQCVQQQYVGCAGKQLMQIANAHNITIAVFSRVCSIAAFSVGIHRTIGTFSLIYHFSSPSLTRIQAIPNRFRCAWVRPSPCGWPFLRANSHLHATTSTAIEQKHEHAPPACVRPRNIAA